MSILITDITLKEKDDLVNLGLRKKNHVIGPWFCSTNLLTENCKKKDTNEAENSIIQFVFSSRLNDVLHNIHRLNSEPPCLLQNTDFIMDE